MQKVRTFFQLAFLLVLVVSFSGFCGFEFVYATGIPTATTLPPDNVTDTSATLRAMVNPNGLLTEVIFCWYPTAQTGSQSPPQWTLRVAVPILVEYALTGLSPSTTYTYYATATNAAGQAGGSKVHFSTLPLHPPPPPPPPLTQNPSLGGASISPNSVNPGDSFTGYYEITNPNSNSIQVGLGLSIRPAGGGGGISDPANDMVVSVHAGTATYSRTFTVPSSASPGPYEYSLAIWSGTPGSSNQYATSGWQSGLTVNSPTPTTPFDFSISLSPPSVTVKPGDTATFQILLTYSDPSYAGTTITIQGITGMGPGMNYQVIPSPPTLQISTSSSTPPGNYPITLTGSANGVMHQANAFVVVQTAEQPFDFSIAASPTQQTVTPGSSTTSTVTVALLSGTSQSVALTVSGAPNGVSATLNPASGTPSFSSILSITTTASVAPGQYTLTITGTAGTTSHQTAFMLTIGIGQSSDFRIDVNPPSQTSNQGGTATYQIDVVSLNGFNSPVTLAVSGLPSDVKGVFSVNSGTPDFTATLTIYLSRNGQVGSFSLLIKGSGGGLDRTANAMLIIAAPTTTTQTENTASGGLLGTLQENSLLIIAALVILVILFGVLAMRGRGKQTIPQRAVPSQIFCGKCGAGNPASNEFCAKCGNNLKTT